MRYAIAIKTETKLELFPDSRLFLASSVSFIDVTEDPENVYKPAPIVSAKLPQDFFYPLFQRGSGIAAVWGGAPRGLVLTLTLFSLYCLLRSFQIVHLLE